MPLDGTLYVADQLSAAKQILIDRGWCIGQRFKMTGERCALGALDAAVGEMVTADTPVVICLAAAIPDGFGRGFAPDYSIALFNNAQGSIDPILQWFERAEALVFA